MEEIRVPLSKIKMLLIMIGAIIFVGIQIVFWFIPTDYNVIFVPLGRTTSFIGIPFFALCSFYATKKLFDKTPGLLINNDGVTDNSSAISAGFIGWANILGFKIVSLGGDRRSIAILVNNSDEIIGMQKGLKQKAMTFNLRKYRTPVLIPDVTLKCDLDELNQKLNTALEQKKQSAI
jgi:hypothetical protein